MLISRHHQRLTLWAVYVVLQAANTHNHSAEVLFDGISALDLARNIPTVRTSELTAEMLIATRATLLSAEAAKRDLCLSEFFGVGHDYPAPAIARLSSNVTTLRIGACSGALLQVWRRNPQRFSMGGDYEVQFRSPLPAYR